ncbi:MAG: 50S ribosomal protein L22 [Tenericutes bacterium]|nr:50S ribosomal protein L22 [Mycoplasmatota bacterium]MDD7630584.1 50S ribosomal protein L22 [bacterium]MDY4108217.1 50S ribosomal protein L22 [Bacilli bacterium]
MEAKAIAKNIRMSADKSRLVINLIRGKKVDEAMSILKNMNNKSARVIEKVLTSAVANAENNHNMKKENLYVSKAYINEGPVIKRMIMDSRGHTGRNDRRTSHVTIVVSEK